MKKKIGESEDDANHPEIRDETNNPEIRDEELDRVSGGGNAAWGTFGQGGGGGQG